MKHTQIMPNFLDSIQTLHTGLPCTRPIPKVFLQIIRQFSCLVRNTVSNQSSISNKLKFLPLPFNCRWNLMNPYLSQKRYLTKLYRKRLKDNKPINNQQSTNYSVFRWENHNDCQHKCNVCKIVYSQLKTPYSNWSSISTVVFCTYRDIRVWTGCTKQVKTLASILLYRTTLTILALFNKLQHSEPYKKSF